MDIRSLSLFNMADRKMDWLTERQKQVAINVANADTPGAKERDLTALDFSSELKSINAANPYVTNSKHMSPGQMNAVVTNPKHKLGVNRSAGDFRTHETRKPYETTINDNSVDIEEEMNKSRKITEQYNMTTTLYKKYTNLIKTSIGKR